MNYTAVLIEHQLLNEALEAFDEARKTLNMSTLFAEERAAEEAFIQGVQAKLEQEVSALRELVQKQREVCTYSDESSPSSNY